MSRRKQARPLRLLEEGGSGIIGVSDNANQTSNGESSGSGSEDEGTSSQAEGARPTSCEGCQTDFGTPTDLSDATKDCRNMLSPVNSQENDAEDMTEDDFDKQDEDQKEEEEARRQLQDAENNNRNNTEDEGETNEISSAFPFPITGAANHVTLEALQNTKVAVAQFAATAMANNADNAAAIQELAVLQSTLYTLQQQQMLQLNLIQQLQQQLQITQSKDSSPSSPIGLVTIPKAPTPPSTVVVPPREATPPASRDSRDSTPPTSQSIPAIPPKSEPSALPSLPPTTISSSLASSIITNYDPPPSPSEPNTLEMLQKRAQEVLDNASQGLLANSLADELSFRKNGGKGPLTPFDKKNEPFFKHRCRYCGKVFGSDSALQIHIRSHTGERPFKCNVCGSRFTTKGNLKVHFQRHNTKFPHIQMNPNPIPEHLDKYHPPLLVQMQSGQGGPPPQFQFPGGVGLYRPPLPHDVPILPPKPVLSIMSPQEAPENLSNKAYSPTPSYKKDMDEELKEEDMDDSSPLKMEVEVEPDHLNERYPSPPSYDECSFDSKYTGEDLLSPGPEKSIEDSYQEQPENLSNKSMSDIDRLTNTPEQRIQPPPHFPNTVSPTSSVSSGSIPSFTPRGFGSHPLDLDPTKDPAVYNILLPRPGSTDNSWESLIEIDKSSETSKLQQLVDNIEFKMTDPNQCIVCHRVLSCKSALQMHYRTHTGERPFRCKICGRAFTTKGNLKTHMGVHRIKPPMRTLHQCPVCHKKFTNGLVLQQHIRLHTGEPTDLTPEQIQAAEIKEFLPHFPPPPFRFPPFRDPPSGAPQLPSEFNNNLSDENKADPFDEPRPTSISPISDAVFNNSINALENQVRTITSSSFCSQNFSDDQTDDMCNNNKDCPPITVNGEKSPRAGSRSGSESGGCCSPESALDLRASVSLPAQSPTLPPPPPTTVPPSMFPFGLLPPGSSPLFSSALNSPPVLTTGFNPLGLPHPDRRFSGRGNTTCQMCFKTFACHSALEIHYRSHTKERPFKCGVCDRGFSTKGNMKQHMLTHKIRDMPPHLFDQQSQSPQQQTTSQQQQTSPQSLQQPSPAGSSSMGSSPVANILSTQPLPSNMMQNERSISVPTPQLCHNSTPQRSLSASPSSQHSTTTPPISQPLPQKIKEEPLNIPISPITSQPPTIQPLPSHHQSIQSSPISNQHQSPLNNISENNVANNGGLLSPPPAPQITDHHIALKRSPPLSTEVPLAKRQPSLPKHLCNVCNKNFSSSSALQIHMRTHTGDKPFRCTICHKAFTTKGNLKVHMGTHMWTNGASRRGRRMSLELPPLPPVPPPKDSDFLHRRPDIFYPYLPAPFLNGLHTQNKLNDIGVTTSGSGMLLYGGYPGGDLKEPRSPDKPQLWEMHFDRKSALDGTSPPPQSPQTVMPPPPPHQSRGEGLAA